MHPRNFRPANRYKAILADRLQRLGDALRLSSKSPEAALAYKEAETLALEVLQTHPNQLDTQLILHLIRRGSSLIATVSPKQDIVSTFGQGLGRFRFGMSVREVSGLLSRRDLATQRVPEYKSGNVQFFWMPMAAFEDVTEIYNKHCVGGSDYVAFMFHNDSLFRISLRFWGGVRGCDDRRFFSTNWR